MDKYIKPGMEKNNNALFVGVLIAVLVIIITLGNCRDRSLFIIYLSSESYVRRTRIEFAAIFVLNMS